MQDVRAYGGINFRTDHKLIIAEILFPYTYKTKDKHEEMKENTVSMVVQKWKYNIESLNLEVQNFCINRD